jgi:diguanylate cyclase (GGDEF)-like protein
MVVLIAEDDATTRLLLRTYVQRLHHTCIEACDGDQAWQIACEQGCDVVVSDFQMPGVDGLELCRRVRRQACDGYVYFMLLTATEGREYFRDGVDAGVDDYILKPVDMEVFNARLRVASRIVTMQNQLRDQNEALERLNRQLYEEGRVDSLTRVGNRLLMQEDLVALKARVDRYGHSICVALSDVDFFKRYNDTCGHLAGDEALRTVADCLQRECREGDSVYRYGGEEFLVVMPEQDLHSGRIAADRIRRSVEAMALPHPGKSPSGPITISSGVAVLEPGTETDIADLLRRADAALYQAKETGRNRVVTYQPGMDLVAA